MSTTEKRIHAYTASTRVIETETGTHDFTVTNVSIGDATSEDGSIRSSSFTVGDYNLVIRLTLIDWSLSNGHLYAYIENKSNKSNLKARSTICLLDQNKQPSKHSCTIGQCSYNYFHINYGEKRFMISRKDLETSNCILNDSITIRCTVTVIKSSCLQNTQQFCSTVLPSANLQEHLGNILDSGEGTDVTFEVDGEIFNAHKVVLAARSPVFKAELWGPMKEATSGRITIKDMKASAFKEMLHFIYRDSLSEVVCREGSDTNQESVFLTEHLLAAADRYGLDRLKLICEEKLCNSINVENVAATLALAEHHNCSRLKEACLKFLVLPDVLPEVVVTDGFKFLMDSCPSVIKEITTHKRTKIL